MRQNCYEVIFKVTETLQNGKERTIRKSVLMPRFKDGKHLTEEYRIRMGTIALKAEHYYRIEYIETKCKTLLWAE